MFSNSTWNFSNIFLIIFGPVKHHRLQLAKSRVPRDVGRPSRIYFHQSRNNFPCSRGVHVERHVQTSRRPGGSFTYVAVSYFPELICIRALA